MTQIISNWQLVKNICKKLSITYEEFSLEQVKDIFEQEYKDRKVLNVAFELKCLSVNSNSRLSYIKLNGYIGDSGKKLYSVPKEDPRTSNPDNPKDTLFYNQLTSKYTLYNPIKHGVFKIVQDGSLRNSIIKLSQWQSDVIIFNSQIKEALNLEDKALDKQCKITQSEIPTQIVVETTRFQRSPYIVAKRLKLANGYCQNCKVIAPFFRKTDNTPYLEVHHIKPLCEGGPDSLENTIALCPNCHRKAHFS